MPKVSKKANLKATRQIAKLITLFLKNELTGHDQCWALDFDICFEIGSSRKILVLLLCSGRLRLFKQCGVLHWTVVTQNFKPASHRLGDYSIIILQSKDDS